MKRFIGLVLTSVLAALFMIIEISLLKDPSVYYSLSEFICQRLGLHGTNVVEFVCLWLIYIITAAPLLWAYFLSVLMVRKSGLKTKGIILTVVVLVAATGVSLLTNTRLYYTWLSKLVYWEVETAHSRIPAIALNAGSCLIAILIIIALIYSPSVKANGNKWFETETLLKTCVRYLISFIFGYCVVIFAVSLRGVLLQYNLKDMPDLIEVMHPYTEGWLGVLLMVFVEPLVHGLAFRGLLFTHFKRCVSPVIAAFVSSFLYAYWYEFLPGYGGMGLYAFFLGILLCSVCNRANRLRFSMLVHGFANFLIFFMTGYFNDCPLGIARRACEVTRDMVEFARANSSFALLSCLVTIGLGSYFLNKFHVE